jgi:chromosome segregation ATPase
MTKTCTSLLVLTAVLAGCTPYHSKYELSSRLVHQDAKSKPVTQAELRKVQSDVRALRRRVAAAAKRAKSGQASATPEQLDALMADVEALKAQRSEGEPQASSDELLSLASRVAKLEENKSKSAVKALSANPEPKLTEMTASLNGQISDLKQRLSSLESAHASLREKHNTFESELDEDATTLINQLMEINSQIEKLEKRQSTPDAKQGELVSLRAAQKALSERLSDLQGDVMSLQRAQREAAKPTAP